jgi:rsbT co-antagonist protein RsbR
MSDEQQQNAAIALGREMGLTDAAIERRQKIVGLDATDLTRIAAIKDIVLPRAAAYAEVFFAHLAALEEARPLLTSNALLSKARQLKTEHLAALVSGQYGTPYVLQRIRLGLLYAKARLDTRVFLGAFHHLLHDIGADIMKYSSGDPGERFEQFMSLKKVAFFDIGLIVDVLVFERERVIRQQQEAIRELSTPVLQIRDRLLLLPIIGVIDTHRARLITESLLVAIRDNRARAVVMDVTGVAAIDSKVANHLMQTVSAARLMGATVIVTGISSAVAQSLVALGIEMTSMSTVGDLQGGLEEAEQMLGLRVVAEQAPLRSRA